MNNTVFNKYADAQTLARIVDFASVSEMWEHSVKEYADNIAIVDDGKNYTFSDLDGRISAYRDVLIKNGVKKGDVVGIYLPNCCDFVVAYMAAVTLGAVAALCPPHLDGDTLFGCSHKFGMSAIVYGQATAEKATSVQARNPRVKALDIVTSAGGSAPAVRPAPSDPCSIVFTGGTTGRSKGALLSNRAVMLGTKNGCYGYANVFEQRYFLVLPLTHVFGLIRNLLFCLYTGSTLYICRNMKDMFKEMLVFKPTVLVMVPALAEMALNLSKQFGRNMLGDSVHTIIAGAAATPAYLINEYHKLGVTVLQGYGLTESANLVSGNPESLSNPSSVGYAYGEQELKVVDGELWIKGPNVMDKYVGDEEETKNAFCDGWFKTGDLVRIDENGFLYIVGRIKELIVLPTGEKISPAEYECKFNALDIIQDSLIYERTTDAGSILVLEVFPRAVELKKLGLSDEKAYIEQQLSAVNMTLPPFARISKFIVRDTDFKRTPAMKIVRD